MIKVIFAAFIQGFKSNNFFTIDKLIKNPYSDSASSLKNDWVYISNDIKNSITKYKKQNAQK